MLKDKIVGVEGLSPRHKQILRLVARHYQAKEIARFLGIQASTVKTHAEEARRRLHAATTREAADIIALYDVYAAIETEGGPPRMGMPNDPDQPPNPAYEQALLAREPKVHLPLERSEDGLENDVLPREGSISRRSPGRDHGDEPDVESGKVDLFPRVVDRLAGGRWDQFKRRLDSLDAFKRLGLILIIALFLALLAGGLISTATGVLWGFRHMLSTVR